VDKAGPGSPDFVGGDRGPHSAPAKGDAPLHLPAGDRLGQGNDEIGKIIIGPRLPIAKINHVISRLPQTIEQIFLQGKAPVVGRDPDHPPTGRRRSAHWANVLIRHIL